MPGFHKKVNVIAACLLFLVGCSSAKETSQTISPSTARTLEVSPAATSSSAPAVPAARQSVAPPTSSPGPTAAARVFPNIPVDHIVVAIEENRSYKQIIGSDKAPYINSLAERGALFTDAHGIVHPSQPNYFALFSGSTQGVKDDSCKGPYTADNLATQLLKAKLSFTGYSEDLPKTGFTGCSSKGYARKHNPWAQFTNVPPELNRPMTDFPDDLSKLPTVSFVVPSQENDMHDGTIEAADDWLKAHLDKYVTWAQDHRSLLIVTWDEDDFAKDNHIPLLMVGPMIKPGKYDTPVNHYHVLRTIEELYGLEPLGEAAKVKAIDHIWK